MKTTISNVFVVAGCASIVYGMSLISPALAFVAGGILALVIAINLLRK